MLLVLLAVVAAPLPAAAGGPQRVAVLEFENELKGIDRVYFSDLVRGAIKEAAPQLLVITRESVTELLTAQGRSLENCEGSCEVQTGRLLGADYVVSGRLTKVGSRLKLTLRVHDTHTGALLGTSAAEGVTPDELDDAAKKAAAQIAEQTHAPAPPPRPLLSFHPRAPTWIGLGLAGATLGTGAFFGLRSRSLGGGDQVQTIGDVTVHSVSEVDAQRADSAAKTANILFIAGAVVGVAALVAGFIGGEE